MHFSDYSSGPIPGCGAAWSGLKQVSPLLFTISTSQSKFDVAVLGLMGFLKAWFSGHTLYLWRLYSARLWVGFTGFFRPRCPSWCPDSIFCYSSTPSAILVPLSPQLPGWAFPSRPCYQPPLPGLYSTLAINQDLYHGPRAARLPYDPSNLMSASSSRPYSAPATLAGLQSLTP